MHVFLLHQHALQDKSKPFKLRTEGCPARESSDFELFCLYFAHHVEQIWSNLFRPITTETHFFIYQKAQGKHSCENLPWELENQPAERRHQISLPFLKGSLGKQKLHIAGVKGLGVCCL